MMTTGSPRPARLAAALVAALAFVLLGGCSGGSPASGEAPAGAPAQPAEEPIPDDGGAPQAPTLPGDRQLARSATVTLEVTEVERAAAELRRVALLMGGMVTSEVVSLPTDSAPRDYDTSRLVLTVPAERLEETLTLVAGLGEVRARTIESVDVTDSVVDVESRVKTMRESIARLQALMARAGSVSDIAQVEAELTQRQAELEALLAQQASLAQQVATSPVAVTLVTAETVVEDGPRGFLAGLESGWDTMVASGVIALTIVGALLPWLALVAVVAVPIWLWRRRRAAARAARQPAPPAPPAAPMPPESGPAHPGAPGSQD